MLLSRSGFWLSTLLAKSALTLARLSSSSKSKNSYFSSSLAGQFFLISGLVRRVRKRCMTLSYDIDSCSSSNGTEIALLRCPGSPWLK